MLGLSAGETTLVALLVFAVVSARFWPAAGAKLAERLSGLGPETPRDKDRSNPKSERTKDAKST